MSTNDGLDLLSLMRAGVDYRFPVKVRKATIQLRVLSQVEELQCVADTNQAYESKNEYEKTEMTYHTLLASHKLVKASTSDVDARDPKLTLLILGQMSNDEIRFLFKEYVRGCEKINPALETISMEELSALVETVKKNSFALTELSSVQLHNLVLHLLQINGELPLDR